LRRRVFFALWPDASVAARLDEAGRRAHGQCGGRRMRRDTLHLTLAFVGEVSPVQMEALERLAASVAGTPFELVLDRLDWVPGKRIVWAGCNALPPLTQLAANLAERLQEGGFRVEERPFAAHVTLLRKAGPPGAPLVAPQIRWRAAEFVLVESNPNSDGARYTVIGRWPLGARQP
jgi:2'-5' RNA ligase